MSVASEIIRLQTAKAGIKSALEAKGVSVSSAATLDEYPQYVEDIPAGGDDTLSKTLIERTATGITIPSDVSSIGSYAFYKAPFTGYTIPNSVTQINEGAFSDCYALTNITLPNVSSLGNKAFYYCTGLTSVDIPNVTSVGASCFYGCKNITGVTANNLTTISDAAFQNCSSLTTFNFSSITSIGNNAFNGCTGLTTASLNSIITIGNSAFNNLSGLTIQNINSGATKIGEYAFQSVNVPSNLSFDSVEIGKNAFSKCYTLTNITAGIKGGNTFSGVLGESCFLNCTGLTTASFIAKNNTTGSLARYCFQGCTSLTSLTLTVHYSGGSSYIYMNTGCCSGCTSLCEIVFDITGNVELYKQGNNQFTGLPSVGVIKTTSEKLSHVTSWINQFTEFANWTVEEIS